MALDTYLPVALEWRDAFALGIFFLCLHGMTYLIERSNVARPSMSRLMAQYRTAWMEVLASRELRIVDASLLAILHRGAGFFASASMIAIGGLAALLWQTDRLVDLAEDFSEDAKIEPAVWEVKILFVLCLMVVAFLKFVWANRLFGYCAVLIGAVPQDGPDEPRKVAASRAAKINITAGRSFNRGLRIVYFSLAALAWFLGPEALAAASVAMTAMLFRREFRSASRQALNDTD